MKIAVCVKQVPDTWAEKRLKDDAKTLDRDSCDAVPNELDDYAVELALQLAESYGAQTVVVSMGPPRSEEMLRRALSMGIDEAVLIEGAELVGSDALATSQALTAALLPMGVDLVLFGAESTDARMGVLPAMVAQRLGWAGLLHSSNVSLSEEAVTVVRVTDGEHCRSSAALPAVVSVVEKINEPRYPSFKGIMAAKKKPLSVRSAADLGLDASQVGTAGSRSEVVAFSLRPTKAKGQVINDEDGRSARAIATFLNEQKVV